MASLPLDPAAFDTDLDRLLAVLSNAKDAGTERLSALEMSEALRASAGIDLHWRSINAHLLSSGEFVDRKKRLGRWYFGILRAGKARVAAPPSAIQFVDPSKAVQSVLTLHGMLSQCKGVLRVCDPYLDYSTLQHLDSCSSATEIRLLTKNVKDSGSLRSLHSAFVSQGRVLVVKIASANILHDRYIIDSVGMKILGTSLNGFGKKQCFVVEVGTDMRTAMTAVFDGHWSTANAWP